MPAKAHKKTAARDGQPRFLRLLHHLGWSTEKIDKATPLPRARGASLKGELRMLPTPQGEVLALVLLTEDLQLLDDSFRRFEDLTGQHRALQAILAAEGVPLRHAVVVDARMNAHLLDLRQEDVLLEVRGEAELVERLLPHLGLTALARGSLSNLARKSLHQRARELGDWVKVWSHAVGAAAHTNPEVGMQFFHSLLLARLTEELELLPQRKVPFRQYGTTARPAPVRYLMEVFRPLVESWNLLQGLKLDTHRLVAKGAEEHGKLGPCLESFSRLSRSKFFAEVLAEAFSDEQLRLVSWRRVLVPEPSEEREQAEDWLTDPVRLNLDECGFGMLLRQFDTITEALRGLAREQSVARERGERPGLQMDLLGGEPPELDEGDAPRLALQRAIRVETAQSQRAPVAKLVLLAHAAHWYARLRRPEPLFPSPSVIHRRGAPAEPRRTPPTLPPEGGAALN